MHLRQPGARESRRAPGSGIRGEPIDLVPGEAGVLDRCEAGVERELERVAEETPPHVRLADAGDARTALEDLRHEPSTVLGSKSGIHTSSRSSNTTRTGIPTRTSRGAHPTTLVVRRTDGSSSSSTMAIT